MEEFLRTFTMLKNQELGWVLSIAGWVLSIALPVIAWVLTPGLILWLVVLVIVFVWHHTGRLGRSLAVAVGSFIIWMECNALAALLIMAHPELFFPPLVAPVLLFVGAVIWLAFGHAWIHQFPTGRRFHNWLRGEE